MVRIFKTIDGSIHEIQEPQEGCWIALTNPTATEIFEISEQFGIEVDDLRAPLDEEERSRIEVEDNYTLILADVPAIEERNEKDWYVTIPLGIIVTQKMIFTVCLEDTQVLTRFMEGRVRNFFTYMKTRFISLFTAFWSIVALFALLSLLLYFKTFNLITLLLVCVIEFAVVFFITRYWIQKEVYDKVNTIYKNIYNFKINIG